MEEDVGRLGSPSLRNGNGWPLLRAAVYGCSYRGIDVIPAHVRPTIERTLDILAGDLLRFVDKSEIACGEREKGYKILLDRCRYRCNSVEWATVYQKCKF